MLDEEYGRYTATVCKQDWELNSINNIFNNSNRKRHVMLKNQLLEEKYSVMNGLIHLLKL